MREGETPPHFTEVNYMSYLIWAYKILDATNASEYNALSDANKDAYRLIASCGVVNFDEGSATYTKLFNIFPDGTTTYDALVALANPTHVPEEPNG